MDKQRFVPQHRNTNPTRLSSSKVAFKGLVYGYASRHQTGAAAVEYTVVTLAVITALFVPLGGEGSLSGVGLLLQGLRNFQMHSTYLLSLP